MSSGETPTFTQGSLMRHIVVMSFTSSIAVMAIYIVDLLDLFFISLLGERKLAAAAGYASTVIFTLTAVNIGLSVAAGSLISRALGADRERDAREIATCVAAISTVTGVSLTLILLPYLPKIMDLLRAEPDVAGWAIGYLWIVLPTTPFSGVAMAAVVALRCRGLARLAVYPALLGAGVNLVFDPILMFGLGLDLNGAAAATSLARAATLTLALYLAVHKLDFMAKVSLPMILRHTKIVLIYTLPAIATSIATPVATAIYIRYVSKYGTGPVAGVAVVGRLFPVVFCVITALSNIIGPIVGQNAGADRDDRVRAAYANALKFIAVYVGAAAVLLFLLRKPIADVFSVGEEARAIVYLFCGPLTVIAMFNGIVFMSNAVQSSLGHPVYAPWITWLKSTVGLVAFLSLGAMWWGVTGVAIGLVVDAGLFAVVSVLITYWCIGRAPIGREPLHDYNGHRAHVLVEKGEAVHG